MKKIEFQKIKSLNQKLNAKSTLISKAQLKQIKGGFIVEENAEGF